MSTTGIVWQDAVELGRLMRARELSAVEVMHAFYDQIERLNPTLNAIVNLLERVEAVELAQAADVQLANREALGPLHGLPVAAKDLGDVADFPTTSGYVPYATRIAERDSEMAARMRGAGVIFIGKTNVPEFGLGSHTFNPLFGAARNPYHPDKTPGGSSGGAAASLAAGMLPIADGSDMGGSLRNPGSFCNVVGFRPSIGRVPAMRELGWFARLSTAGPMARTVADAALLFSVQAGPSDIDPLSLPEPGSRFAPPLDRDLEGLRVAFTPDLGFLPVEPAVVDVCAKAASVLADLGCRVDECCPDLSGAMEVFQTQRAAGMVSLGRELESGVEDWRSHCKDTAIWNIERGGEITLQALLDSEARRTRIYLDTVSFFEDCDVLILPAAQVAPFDISTDWVREINGVAMETYIDWMTVCCAITVTGMPAISVPGGFTPEGLPVGVQFVGRRNADRELLEIAHGFEQATRHCDSRPALAE